MARRFPPRVRVNVASSGTGTLSLGFPVSAKYQSPPADLNLETIDYCIEDGDAWEEGYGVYEHGPSTLTRNLIASSTGSLLDLSGAAVVFSTIASATMERIFASAFELVPVTAFPVGDNSVVAEFSNGGRFRTLVIVIDALQSSSGSARLGMQYGTGAPVGYQSAPCLADNGVDAPFRSTTYMSASPIVLGLGNSENRIVRVQGALGGPGGVASTVGYMPGETNAQYIAHAGLYGNSVEIAGIKFAWSNIFTTFAAGTYAVYGEF